MCGLAGWLSWKESFDPKAFASMVRRLNHRGPDDEGILQHGPMLLGHQRLSIIDLSDKAHQPMADHSGRYWVVLNGEIYNFKALRRELEQKGAQFRTQSDTEVVLEAYKAWGEACLQAFNGMFALALWDEAEQKLFLARDRMGEKPLFYLELEDGLAFASELPALLQHPACKREVDTGALGHYLMLGYNTGENTLVRNIRRLPAASSLVVQKGRAPKLATYWDLAAHVLNKRSFASVRQAAGELRDVIDDSVKLRLVGDVPLGAFLSGGLDSSTVVASMAQHMPREQIKSFTMGFAQNTFDETEHAAAVAKHLGVTHAQTKITPAASMLEKCLMTAAVDPLADTSIVPTFLLAQFARQHVTVALSGDGGDECFAGYKTYVANRLHAALQPMPSWLWRCVSAAVDRFLPVKFHKVGFDYSLRQFLRGMLLSPWRAHYSWRTLFTHDELHEIVQPEWVASIEAHDPFAEFEKHFTAVTKADFLNQALYVDMKTWLVDDVLVKVDRATMAHGLESRAPFLDHRVVEFAASLPSDYKLNGFTGKYILKESQKDRLPAHILHRRKEGFNAPFAHWFTDELKDFAYAELKNPALTALLRPSTIDKIWKDHQDRVRDNGFKLLNLVCLSLWLRHTASPNP